MHFLILYIRLLARSVAGSDGFDRLPAKLNEMRFGLLMLLSATDLVRLEPHRHRTHK